MSAHAKSTRCLPEAARSLVKALHPRWERRKEERPAELLAAALAVFVEKGFAGARLEEVASRAGVSKGTLYLYFRSKEDLFQAVLREYIVQHVQDERLRLAEPGTDPATALRTLLDCLWRFFAESPASGIVKLIVAESRNFPEIARFYTDEVAAPTHELLATALRRGIESGHFRRVDVESFVQMLIAPMLSLALWRHSLVACSVMEIDIDAYHDTYMGTILRALEPERTAARQTAQNEA